MKRPYLQFYTGDYLRDPAVRSVSLAARGLWADMLCLMHQSDRTGYLQHSTGLPITPIQLARMVGCSVEEMVPVLQELEDCGVFSRTSDGVIYNRRMVRDEEKRELCSAAGKRGGGNPALTTPLKVTYKRAVKGRSKGGDKPQSQSQSQSQNTEEPKGSPVCTSEADASTAHASDGHKPADYEELRRYVVVDHKLSEQDAEHFWNVHEENGWTWRNGTKRVPYKSWKRGVTTWSTGGLFPSQRRMGKGHDTPRKNRFDN